MPSLGLHMTIARELACDLTLPAIDAERGAYYLGATTPDIRVLTRWDRAQTHFFDLHNFDEQSGVERLFEREPALRDAQSLDRATAAFMAGYISHLVMDEDYITQIYRPLFGERSPIAGDALADVMDKALQWDIDRNARGDEARAEEIKRALMENAVEVNVGFIARETLLKWREASAEVIATPPTVERLVRFLSRRMPELAFEDEANAATFAEGVPALLARTWEHVGEERIREYLDSTKNKARRAMKEYLS
jgi:Zinc dependent phospholipase C